ncbi:MAG: vitamin K epoxide reductase family protein [Chlamydiales bacterium]|nr:vitamin K epoxide reductase family protein [Chlamydiales bacterium]
MDANVVDIEKRFHNKMMWTRFGTIFLGVWLLTCPESFGYDNQPLGYSDWVSGILLIFFGLISMAFRCRSWIWGGCLVGIWLQFAPLWFWAHDPVIYVNDTLIGVLAIAFCVLVPLRPKEFEVGPQIPKGWTYNPSSWQQRIPVIFFGTVGWFVARYLAAYQLHYTDYVWSPIGGGTEKVITSMVAHNFPVPDAGLGALAYSLEAIMGAKGGVRRWHTMPWLVVAFGFLVVPLGFVSIVLVMSQPILVGAWCFLCLIIACCMLIMLALEVDEVLAVCQYLHQSVKEGKPFWRTFFKGSEYTKDEVDARTPPVNTGVVNFLCAMVWGATLPWNLVITALLGMWLLFANNLMGFSGILSDNVDVMGALIVVCSIISFAEVARALRFCNLALCAWLIIASCIFSGGGVWQIVIAAIFGGVIALLSLFKGARIKESYGNWNKFIF